MANWLGVVSADHVQTGQELGIAQIGHGKRAGLLRMQPGDGLVYYSPRHSLTDARATLKAFTAVGTIAPGDAWQAEEGDFKPWRRRVDYLPGSQPVSLDELRGQLELTRAPNWGVSLRRGLIPLSDHDYALITSAMTAR